MCKLLANFLINSLSIYPPACPRTYVFMNRLRGADALREGKTTFLWSWQAAHLICPPRWVLYSPVLSRYHHETNPLSLPRFNDPSWCILILIPPCSEIPSNEVESTLLFSLLLLRGLANRIENRWREPLKRRIRLRGTMVNIFLTCVSWGLCQQHSPAAILLLEDSCKNLFGSSPLIAILMECQLLLPLFKFLKEKSEPDRFQMGKKNSSFYHVAKRKKKRGIEPKCRARHPFVRRKLIDIKKKKSGPVSLPVILCPSYPLPFIYPVGASLSLSRYI